MPNKKDGCSDNQSEKHITYSVQTDGGTIVGSNFGGSGNKIDNKDIKFIQYAVENKQSLSEAALEIEKLLNQLQNTNGVSLEDAQHQVAKILVTQAENESTFKNKLIRWGQFLGDTAAKTTVSEGVKGVLKLALTLL